MGEWDTKPYGCTGQKNVRGKGGGVCIGQNAPKN